MTLLIRIVAGALGAVAGAIVGFVVLLLVFGLMGGDGQAGLGAIFFGIPLGAGLGGYFAVRFCNGVLGVLTKILRSSDGNRQRWHANPRWIMRRSRKTQFLLIWGIPAVALILYLLAFWVRSWPSLAWKVVRSDMRHARPSPTLQLR